MSAVLHRARRRVDPFLSHGWACFKALNLAGLKIPHSSITRRSRYRASGDCPFWRSRVAAGERNTFLAARYAGVGRAKGLAQEDLPLPVADLQRTREPTGKLRELVVEKRHAALDGVRHLRAVAEAIQDVAGQLCPAQEVLRGAQGVTACEAT